MLLPNSWQPWHTPDIMSNIKIYIPWKKAVIVTFQRRTDFKAGFLCRQDIPTYDIKYIGQNYACPLWGRISTTVLFCAVAESTPIVFMLFKLHVAQLGRNIYTQLVITLITGSWSLWKCYIYNTILKSIVIMLSLVIISIWYFVYDLRIMYLVVYSTC